MKPQAKRIIPGLLLAARGGQISARDVVRACALFAISESNARVALTRLSAEGMIESVDRGIYRLGPEATTLAEDVRGWRRKEARLRPWNGRYVMVHTAHLGRRDRRALKLRERALQLLGFQLLESGLHVRPDNIEVDAAAVRQRLRHLGLEKEAIVLVADALASETERAIARLWDGEALDRMYRDEARKLEDWMARSDQLEWEVAAREAYLLGNQAIRHVVFDPLLPEPLVDVDVRRRFFETVRRMDDLGQRIWQVLWEDEPPDTVQRPLRWAAG